MIPPPAALPQALLALGLDTRLLLPGFAGFLDAFSGVTDVARLRTPFAPERVRVGLARLPGSERLAYLVDHPAFYDRPGNPYSGPDGNDWPDNHRRFGLFSWVAAQLVRGADPDWTPDILHGHDWHAALAAAYLAALPSMGGTSPRFSRSTTSLIRGCSRRPSFPSWHCRQGFSLSTASNSTI
jgi:starch synthase